MPTSVPWRAFRGSSIVRNQECLRKSRSSASSIAGNGGRNRPYPSGVQPNGRSDRDTGLGSRCGPRLPSRHRSGYPEPVLCAGTPELSTVDDVLDQLGALAFLDAPERSSAGSPSRTRNHSQYYRALRVGRGRRGEHQNTYVRSRLGIARAVHPHAGQKGDAPQAAALLEGLPAEVVMADTIDGGRPLLTRFLDANRRPPHSKTL